VQEWVGIVRRDWGLVGFHWRVLCVRLGWVGLWFGEMRVIAYHFYGSVPGAGAEDVFGYEVPMHGEDFSVMLFP